MNIQSLWPPVKDSCETDVKMAERQVGKKRILVRSHEKLIWEGKITTLHYIQARNCKSHTRIFTTSPGKRPVDYCLWVSKRYQTSGCCGDCVSLTCLNLLLWGQVQQEESGQHQSLHVPALWEWTKELHWHEVCSHKHESCSCQSPAELHCPAL